MAQVHVSVAAASDLRSIGLYTEKTWGRAQRRKYLSGIDQKMKFLSENPKIAALRTDYTPSVRIHPHEYHLIVYQDVEDGILVVRVLHRNMDTRAHLSATGQGDSN